MRRVLTASLALLGLAGCTSHEAQVPDSWMFVPSMPPAAAAPAEPTRSPPNPAARLVDPLPHPSPPAADPRP